MKDLSVTAIAALPHNANYIYLVQSLEQVAIVDPGETGPVVDYCDKNNIKPTEIWNTHHHWDHTDANLELKEKFKLKVRGCGADKDRIPGIDISMKDNEEFDFGEVSFRTIAVPGHTHGHMAFYTDGILLPGDTLFSLGCGRLFEGTPEQMYQSLQKLAALPDDTLIFCGHEYTLNNGAFAQKLDPDNEDLESWLEEAEQRLSRGEPSLPTTLEIEKNANPFLRSGEKVFLDQFGTKDPIESFARLRALRDKH